MARIMRMGLLTFVVLLGIAASFYAWRVHLSQQLARASVPAEHYPPESEVNATVVVVGDSTAVGTGTNNPRYSVAGRIASAFRGVEVNNIATVGARARDVPAQLMNMGRARADVILIQVGGNDVMSFESSQAFSDHLLAAVTAARARSDAVILMPAGNVGRAPFFLPPVSWVLSARARQFNFIAMRTAQATGAIFVSLFHEAGEDPFAEAPKIFYARDGLHPSEMGYALWFGELMRQARFARLVGQPERERYSDFAATPADSYTTIRRKPMNTRWMVVHSGYVSKAAALRPSKRISSVASRRAGAQ